MSDKQQQHDDDKKKAAVRKHAAAQPAFRYVRLEMQVWILQSCTMMTVVLYGKFFVWFNRGVCVPGMTMLRKQSYRSRRCYASGRED